MTEDQLSSEFINKTFPEFIKMAPHLKSYSAIIDFAVWLQREGYYIGGSNKPEEPVRNLVLRFLGIDNEIFDKETERVKELLSQLKEQHKKENSETHELQTS